MYTEVSEACKNVVKGNVITTIARLTFEKFFSDSSDLLIEKDISSNGLKIADYCFDPQTGKLIGTAASKELEIEIINTENYELENKEFKLEVGVLIDRENLVYEYIPYGTFLVMSYEDLKSANKYKVIANDTMIKLNPPVRLNTAFTPTYPITAKEYYREFMASYGIEIEEQELCNGDFLIENPLNFEENTGRYVLGKLAELFGSFAKINRKNKCQMYLKTETDETIELSQMNSVLEIDKRYGPVNVVSIGLSQVEGENVTLEDKEGIAANGEITIKIDDNEFMYTEELRERAIDQLFERLKGFTYIPVSFQHKALLYSDCGDAIQVRDIKTGETVDTIILNQDINIPKTRQSRIESKALTNNAQNLKYISQSKQAQSKTEISVKKHEKQIQGLISEVGDRTGKETSLTQDVDSIKTNVGFITDLTQTVSGINPLTLTKCLEGELQSLRIQANNTIFNPLYPSSTLYPSPTLYPRGKTYIKIIHQEIDENDVIIETTKTIDLKLSEPLRMYSASIYDEFVYEATVEEGKSKARVIRRVGVLEDGTFYALGTEVEEDVDIADILVGMGTNIITFNDGHYGQVSATYIQESTFTKLFATTYQVNSFVTQLADSIDLLVKEKVGKNEVIADLNIAVKNGLGIIEVIANSFILNSDHAQLTADGILTLKNKTTEPYRYTYNDVLTTLNYISGDITLSDELINLYDANNDGVIDVLDVTLMLNIIKGTAESEKYADAEITFNPLSPTDFITMSLSGAEQCRIGLNEIYNYTYRGMNMFLGIFADLSNQYGIKLDGQNGIMRITSQKESTETYIDANKVDAYYVLSGSQGKKGRCLHGIDETHDYLCHWNGTQLQFYVDSTVVGSLSDRRLKKEIKDIDERLVNAIDDLGLKQFKLKNKNGKISIGIIAQDLIKAFEKHDLNINDYDFITKTQYSFNNKTLYYIVNYEQFLILHSKLLRNKIDKQQKAIDFLAEKLNCKEELEIYLKGE